MSKIYKDIDWSITLLKTMPESLTNKPFSGIQLIRLTKVYDSCIFFKIEKNSEDLQIIVLVDLYKTPLDFYYVDLKNAKILDISEVSEIVPLQIISKIFKFVNENESKLSGILIKTTIINNSDWFRGNYKIQDNIFEIIKSDSQGKIICKFNEGKVIIDFKNLNKEGNSLKLVGDLTSLNLFNKKFEFSIKSENTTSLKKNILEKILELINDNISLLEQSFPKKDYTTFDFKGIGRSSMSFTFGKLPEKSGKRTLQFIEHIKQKMNTNECATQKSFLESIKKPTYSGYLSSFFSAIYRAGLVDRIKNPSGSPKYCYVLGKNYKAWQEGKLKKIRG